MDFGWIATIVGVFVGMGLLRWVLYRVGPDYKSPGLARPGPRTRAKKRTPPAP